MEIYMLVVLFIFGTIFGSFFGVVGERLSNGESIISPPSHCSNCKHKLNWYELIPILSFVIQKGKCSKCGIKLSYLYPLIEILTGILFVISYLSFGISFEFFISLLLSSYLVTIIVSDFNYYIIPDEVTFSFVLILIIMYLCNYGLVTSMERILDGGILFIIMYLLLILGKIIFKRDCLGGGDVKLMLIAGITIHLYNGLFSIFLASLLALPLSIFVLFSKKEHIIPFGPFLALSTLIIYQTNFDIISYIKELWNIQLIMSIL